MKQLGKVSDEILSSCHPNASQTIEQQASMIESGWYKVSWRFAVACGCFKLHNVLLLVWA